MNDDFDEDYTATELEWLELMAEVDRDFEAGMYDEECAA